MAQRLEDRVLETSASTGTGNFTLAGAVLGFRTFNAAVSTSDTMPYYIEAVNSDGVPTGEYEVGYGTYNGSNVLARTTVLVSSKANAAVNFSAGTKRVGLGIPAPNTDTMRAMWRSALRPVVVIPVAVSDEGTLLTTGLAKVTFRMPFALKLTAVRASVTEAPTGSVLTVDINEGGSSILSTKLTIDATEKTSTTAATPAVISDSDLADDAEVTIDIDGVGSSSAGKGLKVYLIGYIP